MSSTSPRIADDTSRESSPQRSPPDKTRKRDRYALLFGVQVTDVDRAGSHMLPHYAWNETIIKDILGAEIQEITDVVVLSPVECMVFSGQCSRGQGFTQTEAMEIARQLHDSNTVWIGRCVWMRCASAALPENTPKRQTRSEVGERIHQGMHLWKAGYAFAYQTTRR